MRNSIDKFILEGPRSKNLAHSPPLSHERLCQNHKDGAALLAHWLGSAENPLTARVMVNRIWQFRMGAGLVRTPNDFGVLGDRPGYHKKLLDWLAVAFVEGNWSVKAIDRLMVMSSAYQQAAAPDTAKSAVDPENRFYWRMNRKRMEAAAEK